MHTDAELVSQSLSRSDEAAPRAFAELARRHTPALMALLWARLKDRPSAEEAAQEALVRSYRGLAGLHSPEKFGPWLLGIAGKVALETLRRRASSPAELGHEPPAESGGDAGLWEAVAGLAEADRLVIVGRFVEGLSCAEIAARQGVTVGTVTKRLSRAYATLRQKLRAPEDATAEAKP